MAGEQQAIDLAALNKVPGVTTTVFTFFWSSEN